jgi:hypothetical protein
MGRRVIHRSVTKQSQREQLAQRIETLKIRHQTASLSADADTSTFDGHLQT